MYDNLSALELRELFLRGTLDAAFMGKDEYERLFGYETESDDPDGDVLVFCSNGLNNYAEYRKDTHRKLPFDELRANISRKPRALYNMRTAKRAATVAVAVVMMFVIATAVAAAMGFNLMALIRDAINSPDNTAADRDYEVVVADETRMYGSFIEMLEAEALNILYPATLPDEYSFTDFFVTVSAVAGRAPEITASANEPPIVFNVKRGVNMQIDAYSHEAGGIKYNVTDMPELGLYTAYWSIDGDYYTLTVGSTAHLHEIMGNLKQN